MLAARLLCTKMSLLRAAPALCWRSFIVLATFATVLATAALLAAPLNDIFGTPALQGLDYWAWDGAHAKSSPAVIDAALIVSGVHGTAGIVVLTVLGALAWKHGGHGDASLRLLVAVPGVMLLNALVKMQIHRARPDWAVVELPGSFSFPSGHVAEATVFYGALALEAGTRSVRRNWQAALTFGTIGMVGLVALSRIVLGVHFLSDCAGAVIEGVVWLAACFGCRRSTQAGSGGVSR